MRRPFEEVFNQIETNVLALASERDRYKEALIRCAEIAGEDGEAIEAARSGAMTFPSIDRFAIDAVDRLRRDYDNG